MATATNDSHPCVSLFQVSKKYLLGETEIHALRGLSFEIKRGAFTALVGSSGSGKSTLLNIIGCIDEPDSGKILLDGVDVTLLSEKERSKLRNEKIGFVFQSFNLIPVLTAYENVELPLLIHPKLRFLYFARPRRMSLGRCEYAHAI